MVFAIAYTIDTSKKDYSRLYDKIKSYGTWMHYFESLWFVEITDQKTPKEIYDELIPFISGESDYLLIFEIKSTYYGWLPEKAWEWIQERHFG